MARAIRVRVPNALFRDWLTKHYAAVLDEALGEVERTGTPVAFVTDDERRQRRSRRLTPSRTAARA